MLRYECPFQYNSSGYLLRYILICRYSNFSLGIPTVSLFQTSQSSHSYRRRSGRPRSTCFFSSTKSRPLGHLQESLSLMYSNLSRQYTPSLLSVDSSLPSRPAAIKSSIPCNSIYKNDSNITLHIPGFHKELPDRGSNEI